MAGTLVVRSRRLRRARAPLAGAVLAAIAVAGLAAAAPEDDRLAARLADREGKARAAARRATPSALSSEPGAATASVSPGASDVLHYRLDLELLPAWSGGDLVSVALEGTSTIDLAAGTGGLETFVVDLAADLVVETVTGDVAAWQRAGDTLEITLAAPLAAGETARVAVRYAGVPGDPDAFRWWTRAPGEGYVATLSQPFFARTWWPAKDVLGDKATMETNVVVPDGWVALSNGIEVGTESLPGGRTRLRWHESQPMIPYLASLAVGPYERYELGWEFDAGAGPETLSVPCWVYPGHFDADADVPRPSWKAGCDELPEMLETFSTLFGLYPFTGEKYGVVETGGPGGLGPSMEHQTLSSMRRISSFTDVMAHEAAHQWWGDEVTCATWNDIWLNEGFATYAEALFRETRPDGAGSDADGYWTSVLGHRPQDPDEPVWRSDVRTAGRIFRFDPVYRKGAWVLHMLRGLLGDTAFFQALADYRSAHGHGSATTADLAAAVSASVGHDLGWFFDQWVRAPGSPDLEWSAEADVLATGPVVKLRVRQLQPAEGFGLFTLPLDVRVETPAGSETHRVWHDAADETWVLPTADAPTAVTLDEDGAPERHWVLTGSRVETGDPVAGPPVLMAWRVEPGVGAGGETEVTLWLSEDVGGFEPGDVALAGAATGTHAALAASFDAGARAATLRFPPLAPDDYVLRVLSAGVTAFGAPLDGETDTDAWWDDRVLPSGDGEPGGDALFGFAVAVAACSNGADDDGDGAADFPADASCKSPSGPAEITRCSNGTDDDGDGGIDWDGGPGGTPADPQCGAGWQDREAAARGCGQGAALALLLPVLVALRRRLPAPRRPTPRPTARHGPGSRRGRGFSIQEVSRPRGSRP